jgi:hypothetical protein
MNTLQLAKIKQHLLQEIGDASAQAYDWDVTKDEEETREYEFSTDSTPPTKYIVDLYELEPDPDDETNPGISLKINCISFTSTTRLDIIINQRILLY